MALPKIDKPLFDVEIPVLNQKGKFRPYTVKEEKILLLAQQSDDIKQIILATKQVINNCMEHGDIDLDSLPSWGIEFLLLELRKRSVGETVTVAYRDKEDNEKYEFEVDLDDIQIKIDPDHTNTVQLTEEIGLVMSYPTLDMANKIDGNSNEVDFSFDVLCSCINQVYTSDEVMEFGDYSREEQEDFLNQLNREEMDSIVQFFDKAPRLSYTIEYTNSNGTERKIELRNLSDFFS